MYSSSLVLEQDAVLESQINTPMSGGLPEPIQSSGIRQRQPTFNLPPLNPSAGASSGLNPASLRFNYKVEGDAAFKPTQVFDDGKFTFLRMPQDVQELPAVFSVIEGQDYALVNYTVDGSYIVAQRLLDTAVLKLGKAEVRVTKVKPSEGFMGFLGGDAPK
jgi:type IV secretion system protein VirB9